MANSIEANVFGSIAELVGRFPTTRIEGAHHIANAQEWLQGDGSLLVYFLPHTYLYDPVVLTECLIRPELLPFAKGRFAWPTSVKMIGNIPEVKTVGIASKGSHGYADKAGFEMIPVFQHYLQNQYPHLHNRAQETNKHAVFRSIDVLREPGSILAIAFEGTRRKDGRLYRGDPNARIVVGASRANIAALPVVLSGMSDIKGNMLGMPFADVGIHVGSLVTAKDASDLAEQYAWVDPEKLAAEYNWDTQDTRKFTSVDALMLHAARELPLEQYLTGVDPRGIYADENIMSLR